MKKADGRKNNSGQTKAEEDKKVRLHFLASPGLAEWMEANIPKYKRSAFINEAIEAAKSVEHIPAEGRAKFVQDAIAEKLKRLSKSITLP